jgi:hypothetical protein
MFDNLDDEEKVDLALGAYHALSQLVKGSHIDTLARTADLAPLLDVIGAAIREAMPKIGTNHPRTHLRKDMG